MTRDKGVILSSKSKTKCVKLSVKNRTLIQTYESTHHKSRFFDDLFPPCMFKWTYILLRWSKFLQTMDKFRISCRLKSSWNRRNSFFFVVLIIFSLNFFLPRTTADRFNRATSNHVRNKRRTSDFRRTGGQCEKITIPTCIDIGYNYTDISLSPSNMFKQEEAEATVKQFTQIFELACAEEMKQLVCAIYVPICMPTYHKFLPPCRHICERAKKGCGPIFEKYEVDWPKLLRCENFPPFSEEDPLCLHFNRSAVDDIPPTNPATMRLTSSSSSSKTETWTPKETNAPKINSTISPTQTVEDQCNCHCHHPMISLTDPEDILYDKVSVGRTSNCVIPCKSPYFTRDELSMLQSCITALAVLCFVVTSLTVGTFLIDSSRFNYPERTIIFLSFCYMFVSMGFLIRIAAGHDAVACGWRSDRVLYSDSSFSFLCGLVYFLLYFFGMAGAVWWVILSFTWLLASGLKWSSEAISSYSQAFHLVAWIIPATQTIVVFALGSVDGDSVSGLCFVGNQDVNDAYHLVIVPLLLYVSLGSIFSLFGFFDLCRIRTSIKKAKTKPPGFDKMISRMGFFSLSYVLFSAIYVVCYFYELLNRNKWADAKNCRKAVSGGTCSLDNGAVPDVSIFAAKYSMLLLIGTTNGIWVCSQKTAQSWKRFYKQSFVFVCGSDGLVSWFKEKKKKESSKDSQSGSITARESEQTSIEVVPESSVSGVDHPNQGSASTLNDSVASSSRQDSAVICNHKNYEEMFREHHCKHRSSCGCDSGDVHGSKQSRNECRVQLLNCDLKKRATKAETSADLRSECARLTSVRPKQRSSRSSTDQENYFLHFPSKYFCDSSKQCIVYCSHPEGVPVDRSSPTSMKIGSDGKIQHVHHHLPPTSGFYLQTTQQHSKTRNYSQSCKCGSKRHSHCTEQNSYCSNSLHR